MSFHVEGEIALLEKRGRRRFLEECVKNRRIVIYGALDSGQKIYKELQDREWGEVVAVVDRDAEKLSMDHVFHCPLLKPEKLFEGLEWDYVYLATSSPNARKEIKRYLMEHGTQENRILLADEVSFFDGKNEYRMYDDPEKAVCQIIQANDNLKGEYELTLQYEEWMEEYYYSILIDQPEYIERIRTEFSSHSLLDVRIMLGLYLFKLKALEADGMKKLMGYILQLPDEQVEWLYLLGYKIAYMESHQNKILYKDLGADRRALWEKVVDICCLERKKETELPARKKGRVAVLVPIVSHPGISSGTMLYSTVVNSLCEQGKQVKLFIIPYAQRKSFGFLSTSDTMFCERTRQYIQANRETIDSGVSIEVIEKEDISDMLNTAIDRITEFQPQYIIDIMDELCPVSAVLYKYYPVLYRPTTCSTTTGFFEKAMMQIFKYNSEIISRQIPVPILHIKKEPACSYNKWNDLGIPEESFVVVTVGERLSSEVDIGLVKSMEKVMQKKKDMYWILVGDIDVKKNLIGIEDEIHNRIRVLIYEGDLPALYQLCDVFLNPDRVGGGFSIMFAMQQGVVIAALKKNLYGGAARVGEEELIDGGYEELCGYVEELYDLPELLEETKERMRKISQEKCDIKLWGSALCTALEETERSFMEGD